MFDIFDGKYDVKYSMGTEVHGLVQELQVYRHIYRSIGTFPYIYSLHRIKIKKLLNILLEF